MGYEDYYKELCDNRIVTRKIRLRDIIYSNTACIKKIDNRINEDDRIVWLNVKFVAEAIEDCKVLCDITITSWFRCLELNRALGSKDTSKHLAGFAIDFVTKDVEKDYEMLVKELPKYTRLILEVSKKKKWIHLEYNGINDKIHFRLDV